MIEVRNFTYTKDNGETSERTALVISKPQKNYLTLEVNEMSPEEIKDLQTQLQKINEFRDEVISKSKAKWKAFKPEGVSWHNIGV